jgi:hypothetical protein
MVIRFTFKHRNYDVGDTERSEFGSSQGAQICFTFILSPPFYINLIRESQSLFAVDLASLSSSSSPFFAVVGSHVEKTEVETRKALMAERASQPERARDREREREARESERERERKRESQRERERDRERAKERERERGKEK